MEIDSEDYHDYVFRQGKLVGEFEQMYCKAKEIPWHQDKIADELDLSIARSFARVRSPYDTILDVGCGLGYFAYELSGLGRNVYGIDVSPISPYRSARGGYHREAGRSPALSRHLRLRPGRVSRAVLVRLSAHARGCGERHDLGQRPRLSLDSPELSGLGGQFCRERRHPDARSSCGILSGGRNVQGGLANVLEDRAKGKDNDDWHTFLLAKSGRDHR